MRRTVVTGAMLVTAVLVGAAGSALWPEPTPLERLCQAETDLVQARGDGIVGSGPSSVTVLGDSYAQGMELARPLDSWPATFAAVTDSTVRVVAASGTGFTNPGPCGAGAFLERRPDVPGLLVVQGGLNDVHADHRALSTAVCRVLDRSGTTVVVGPPLVPAVADELVVAADAVMRRATARCGGEYVSAISWRLRFLPIGPHMTPGGHRRFGRLVAREIEKRGISSFRPPSVTS